MLEIGHISFQWDRAPLLEDVTFTVAPGEVVLLAGANGAGKTTLMKILAGLLHPASGTIRFDGFDVFAAPLRYRRLMGYLPESAPAEEDMAVQDYLKYRARLRGELSKKIRHRVEEALELCALEAHAASRIEVLSQGLRKRVALADALLLRPRVLLLDDLLAGLDIDTRETIGGILAALSSFAAIVLAGHELDEMASYVTKYVVLKRGKALQAKTPAGVRTILRAAAAGGAS
ncbi:MAG: ATP-binding cassette domain-containing protein [Kiritimatiellia bacterium]